MSISDLALIDSNPRLAPTPRYDRFVAACHRLDGVLLRAYGLASVDRDYLSEANDEADDGERIAHVVEAARMLNAGEIDTALDETRRLIAAAQARLRAQHRARTTAGTRDPGPLSRLPAAVSVRR